MYVGSNVLHLNIYFLLSNHPVRHIVCPVIFSWSVTVILLFLEWDMTFGRNIFFVVLGSFSPTAPVRAGLALSPRSRCLVDEGTIVPNRVYKSFNSAALLAWALALVKVGLGGTPVRWCTSRRAFCKVPARKHKSTRKHCVTWKGLVSIKTVLVGEKCMANKTTCTLNLQVEMVWVELASCYRWACSHGLSL